MMRDITHEDMKFVREIEDGRMHMHAEGNPLTMMNAFANLFNEQPEMLDVIKDSIELYESSKEGHKDCSHE